MENIVDINHKFHVIVEERPFVGTALEILEECNKYRFAVEVISVEEFMEEVPQTIFRLFTVGIAVPKDAPVEERALILVKQLLHHGFLQAA